jgi:hypothetical protein
VFGNHKKLYSEGAQAEGVVMSSRVGTPGNYTNQLVTVQAKLPDGSTVEFKKHMLDWNDVGVIYVGSVVPVRYDPSDHSKVVLDIPAMKERYQQSEAAKRAGLNAQVAQLGEPGSPALGGTPIRLINGLGDLGALKDQIAQAAAQNPGSSSDPVDRLAKLATLKQQGLLSEAEFAAAKAKILSES